VTGGVAVSVGVAIVVGYSQMKEWSSTEGATIRCGENVTWVTPGNGSYVYAASIESLPKTTGRKKATRRHALHASMLCHA